MIKQLYSIIQLDEAIKTMEAGADNIGLVPMQMGGVPAHRVPLYRVDQIHEECRLRGVKMVLIMLTNDPDEMIDLAKRLQPEILHVAGDGYTADEEFAKRLKEVAPDTELMQAVLVDDEGNRQVSQRQGNRSWRTGTRQRGGRDQEDSSIRRRLADQDEHQVRPRQHGKRHSKGQGVL